MVADKYRHVVNFDSYRWAVNPTVPESLMSVTSGTIVSGLGPSLPCLWSSSPPCRQCSSVRPRRRAGAGYSPLSSPGAASAGPDSASASAGTGPARALWGSRPREWRPRGAESAHSSAGTDPAPPGRHRPAPRSTASLWYSRCAASSPAPGRTGTDRPAAPRCRRCPPVKAGQLARTHPPGCSGGAGGRGPRAHGTQTSYWRPRPRGGAGGGVSARGRGAGAQTGLWDPRFCSPGGVDTRTAGRCLSLSGKSWWGCKRPQSATARRCARGTRSSSIPTFVLVAAVPVADQRCRLQHPGDGWPPRQPAGIHARRLWACTRRSDKEQSSSEVSGSVQTGASISGALPRVSPRGQTVPACTGPVSTADWPPRGAQNPRWPHTPRSRSFWELVQHISAAGTNLSACLPGKLLSSQPQLPSTSTYSSHQKPLTTRSAISQEMWPDDCNKSCMMAHL